jgi:hemoglobin
MRKQIESRDDLTLLVTTFYDKIKADEEIGFSLMK